MLSIPITDKMCELFLDDPFTISNNYFKVIVAFQKCSVLPCVKFFIFFTYKLFSIFINQDILY